MAEIFTKCTLQNLASEGHVTSEKVFILKKMIANNVAYDYASSDCTILSMIFIIERKTTGSLVQWFYAR